MPTPRKTDYKTLPEALEKIRHVRLEQVLQIVPVGQRTWLRGVKDGRFPQPVKLGPGVTVWSLLEIKQLLEVGVPVSNTEQIRMREEAART